MTVIFDVDGTLIGGEATDWDCFGRSFHSITGIVLDAAFFANVKEVTAQAIVHQALAHHPEAHRENSSHLIRAAFAAALRAAHEGDCSLFPATPGAHDLLAELRTMPGIRLAIATGDWHDSISFKLAAAGIDCRDIPMATSSDRAVRSEIIALAAERVGAALDETIYVGDGPWDFAATQRLGIPFIGIGKRIDRLREAGAVHALPDLEPGAFLEVLGHIRAERRKA